MLLSSLPLRPQPQNSGITFNTYQIGLKIISVQTFDPGPFNLEFISIMSFVGEMKRSTSMSFVDGNLGTWPKEKRSVHYFMWK